jgi:Rps23 Pro-64 3,4-dihydroxylase Tpa1-like proline 4-hydroxylase
MTEAEHIAPRKLMPLPPHRVYRGFLDSITHEKLLAWAIENEAKFEPSMTAAATVRSEAKQNSSVRTSLRVREFGPIKTLLRSRLLDFVPVLIRDLRVTSFQPCDIELELVANNDGAFFKRHIDIFVGAARKSSDRLLSAVYYFHSEPKAFSGGALRLYSFEDPGTFVEVQPEQNTLLVFPSWASHEVRPVSCPSGRFSHSRFNVNCWVHRKAPGTQDPRS